MSYKDNLKMKVATSNSCELVALQYEAILEEIKNLKESIINQEAKQGFEALDKIRDILSNLISTLGEEQTEFKNKTISLYLYANEILNKSYFEQNTSKLEEIEKIFTSQKDAWIMAGKNLKIENKNKTISNSITYGKTDVNVFGSFNDFGRG